MQRQEDRLQQPLLQEVALQRALLTKMMLASVVCCVIGAVGMGLFRHYLLMGIFLAAIAVIYVCALLAKRRSDRFTLGIVEVMLDHADSQAKRLVDWTHPFSVSFG